MNTLVSTAWLQAALGDADLVVFDATYYLPTEQRSAIEAFQHARIPGARFFDIDAIADAGSSLPHMVPTAAQFERQMAALGVSKDSRVVVYDQKGLFSAARAWWMLRLFGHAEVAVLDGGLKKWQAEARPLEAGSPAPVLAGNFTATLRLSSWRGIGDVLANLESQRECVLDARAAARYAGHAPEPRAGVVPGHIPGSINLPYTELLQADGTLLAAEALRQRFAQAGVDAHSAVIVSCGSGITATVLALGLHVAGYADAAVYDGSWSEWGARADTPKRSGSTP